MRIIKSDSGLTEMSFHSFNILQRIFTKSLKTVLMTFCFILFSTWSYCQTLHLNDLGYFETPGVNIFVYSNQYTGMFNDEKNAGIEIIHHGVRT